MGGGGIRMDGLAATETRMSQVTSVRIVCFVYRLTASDFVAAVLTVEFHVAVERTWYALVA